MATDGYLDSKANTNFLVVGRQRWMKLTNPWLFRRSETLQSRQVGFTIGVRRLVGGAFPMSCFGEVGLFRAWHKLEDFVCQWVRMPIST